MRKLVLFLTFLLSLFLLPVAQATTLASSHIYLPLILRGIPPATPTPRASPSPSGTPTLRPTPTMTAGRSSTPSPTATAPFTPRPTNTATRTPTFTLNRTPSPTQTRGPTINDLIDYLDGVGLLYSDEAQPVYLGTVSSNCYSSDSIVNKYGSYGSEYSSTSISNEFGRYGSPYSSYSAFNDYALHPPAVWTWDGYQWLFWTYVTSNPYKYPRIDSAYFLAYLRWKGGCS